MRRTLNAIGALIFIGLGMFFLVGWLTGDEVTNQRESGAQYSQFIAAAFCLSVGTVLGWRASRQPSTKQSSEDQAGSKIESKNEPRD